MTVAILLTNTIGTWVIVSNSIHLAFVYYIIQRVTSTKQYTFTL